MERGREIDVHCSENGPVGRIPLTPFTGTAGRAEPVLNSRPMANYLLVHGGWCWRKAVPLLEAGGHTVLTPDLPGHGEDHVCRRHNGPSVLLKESRGSEQYH